MLFCGGMLLTIINALGGGTRATPGRDRRAWCRRRMCTRLLFPELVPVGLSIVIELAFVALFHLLPRTSSRYPRCKIDLWSLVPVTPLPPPPSPSATSPSRAQQFLLITPHDAFTDFLCHVPRSSQTHHCFTVHSPTPHVVIWHTLRTKHNTSAKADGRSLWQCVSTAVSSVNAR